MPTAYRLCVIILFLAVVLSIHPVTSADRSPEARDESYATECSTDCPCPDQNQQQPTWVTPLARVYRSLRELRKHVNADNAGAIGRARNADAERLRRMDRFFRNPIQAPPHDNPCVHAVGFYGPVSETEPVEVHVTDCSGPIVLVVTGYDSMHWHIELADAVQLDFVICTGYERQTVTGLPDDVPVFSRYYGSPAVTFAYAYGADRREWGQLEAAVREWTGLPGIHTIQGGYNPLESAAVVGPANTDWRVQMLDQECTATQCGHTVRPPLNRGYN
jgi:hypothetical protein